MFLALLLGAAVTSAIAAPVPSACEYRRPPISIHGSCESCDCTWTYTCWECRHEYRCLCDLDSVDCMKWTPVPFIDCPGDRPYGWH